MLHKVLGEILPTIYVFANDIAYVFRAIAYMAALLRFLMITMAILLRSFYDSNPAIPQRWVKSQCLLVKSQVASSSTCSNDLVRSPCFALWKFDIDMEHDPFVDDLPIELNIAIVLDYQTV